MIRMPTVSYFGFHFVPTCCHCIFLWLPLNFLLKCDKFG